MYVMELLSVTVVLLGAGLVWHSNRIWFAALRRPAQDLNRLVVMIQAFRAGVIGLAVIGVGAWLLTGQLWILVVSLGVGGEELLESSFILWALGTDPRTRTPAALNQPEPAQPAD